MEPMSETGAMNLPGGKPPGSHHHDEGETVVKDPTSKRFWRARNITALVLMSLVPVVGKEVWGAWTSFKDRQAALESRLAEMERDRSANEVIRNELATLKDRMIEHEIQARVAEELQKRTIDLWWTRIADPVLDEMPKPIPKLDPKVEPNPKIVPPPKPEPPALPPDVFKVPKTNPDQFKQQYPVPNEPFKKGEK